MPLIQTAPPETEPITVAEAKTHLRVTHDSDDVYIGKLIAAARRACEQRLNLRLITQNWSLYVDRWPGIGALMLCLAPVSAIDDVVIYGEDGTPALLDPAHYVLDHVSRPARLALRADRPRPQPGRMLNGIEVKMTVGFGSAAADVPPEIRQAILVTVAHWYDRRGEGEGASLPLAALELLTPHRPARVA